MNIIKNFLFLFESGIVGIIATAIYLFVSHLLDKIISVYYSNIICLLLGSVIDFLGALLIFTGNLKEINSRTISLFILGSIIGIIISHIIFVLVYDYIKKRTDKKQLIFKKNITVYCRIISSSITFLIFAFPFRRFIIFSKY